jgi:hypothetical protein
MSKKKFFLSHPSIFNNENSKKNLQNIIYIIAATFMKIFMCNTLYSRHDLYFNIIFLIQHGCGKLGKF